MADEITLRFRHISGDIGPHTFADSTTIQAIKDKLVAEWPKDGPLSKESPTQTADVKLIMSGKYIENVKALRDYKKDMGELKPDSIVTLHVVIRVGTATKKEPAAGAQKQEEVQKGCACIIC